MSIYGELSSLPTVTTDYIIQLVPRRITYSHIAAAHWRCRACTCVERIISPVAVYAGLYTTVMADCLCVIVHISEMDMDILLPGKYFIRYCYDYKMYTD